MYNKIKLIKSRNTAKICRFNYLFVLFLMLGGADNLCAQNDVRVITREEWGAHVPTKPMATSKPVRLTIHHTGTRSNTDSNISTKLRYLQRFSQSDGKLADGRTKASWADVPYHYYIDNKGSIAEGREDRYIGDSNTAYDLSGHLSVVMEGNFETSPPTDAQLKSLTALLTKLAAKYHIRPEHIGAHRSFAKTVCPGRYMIDLLPGIRAAVASRLARGIDD